MWPFSVVTDDGLDRRVTPLLVRRFAVVTDDGLDRKVDRFEVRL